MNRYRSLVIFFSMNASTQIFSASPSMPDAWNQTCVVVPATPSTLALLSQSKPENKEGKGQTHVAATLSVSEQVLLMTSKVNITAPDGSSTIVRALIDSGSSASFIHEQLA